MGYLKMVGTDGYNPVELPLGGLLTVERYTEIQLALGRIEKNSATIQAYFALMIKQYVDHKYRINKKHLKILRENGLTKSPDDDTIPKDVFKVVRDNLQKPDKRKYLTTLIEIKKSRLQPAETEP